MMTSCSVWWLGVDKRAAKMVFLFSKKKLFSPQLQASTNSVATNVHSLHKKHHIPKVSEHALQLEGELKRSHSLFFRCLGSLHSHRRHRVRLRVGHCMICRDTSGSGEAPSNTDTGNMRPLPCTDTASVSLPEQPGCRVTLCEGGCF